MKYIFGSAIVLMIMAASCKKTDDTPAGGKGGNAVLNVYVAHHLVTKNLTNMTVYIKYNTSDAPATIFKSSDYDDSAHCIDNGGVPFGTISGLKQGSYYLYGAGFDTSIKKPVHGGISYPVTNETSQQVNLPVSEE